ncbi:MAG: hypothetical protein HPZ91_03745 [Lentisphaeria bacterium]|nr:hypothetical protein [Lentisphaeria bacterium]
MKKRPTVCTYYFPNWHVDPRNEAIHGKGWTEWRVAQHATPRYPGHDQPKIPLWGYEDEADPAVMAKKIGAASEYGIDAFIFDWYWYADGPYRERCLCEGFFGAPNNDKLKFAVMWANHEPVYAHPGSYRRPAEPLWNGAVDADTFRRCTDRLIATCFNRPNYLRVDGKLYFSLFRAKAMVDQLGGPESAKEIFSDFRRRVEKAGLGEVMLDCMANNISAENGFGAANRFLGEIGVDCCSNYIWGNLRGEDFPSITYEAWFERCKGGQRQLARNLAVPYNPVVALGWDSSPRTVQSDMYEKGLSYPFGVVVTDNTPELFRRALEYIGSCMDAGDITGSLIHLACWNEWTEGACLEPDAVNGYGMLRAVREVFGCSGEGRTAGKLPPAGAD